MEIIKEYEAKLDSKYRITIRGSEYKYYHVKEFEDGRLELLPKILVDPEEIFPLTLSMMDNSVKNLKRGKVSGPVDLTKLTDNGNT